MISKQTRFKIWRDADWKCYYCGEDMGDSPTLDHKIPTSKGGSDSPENLVACCEECNCSKRSKTPDEFAVKIYHRTRAGRAHWSLREIINSENPISLNDSILTKQEWEFLVRLADRIFDTYPRPSFPATKPLCLIHNDISKRTRRDS